MQLGETKDRKLTRVDCQIRMDKKSDVKHGPKFSDSVTLTTPLYSSFGYYEFRIEEVLLRPVTNSRIGQHLRLILPREQAETGARYQNQVAGYSDHIEAN